MRNLKNILLSAVAAVGIGVVHHQDASEVLDGDQRDADKNIPSAYLERQGCDPEPLERGKGVAQCSSQGTTPEI